MEQLQSSKVPPVDRCLHNPCSPTTLLLALSSSTSLSSGFTRTPTSVPAPRPPAGKFEKGMKVKVARTGRTVTLAAPQRMFANERSTVQEGFAGGSFSCTRC